MSGKTDYENLTRSLHLLDKRAVDSMLRIATRAQRYDAIRNTLITRAGRVKTQAQVWNCSSRKDFDKYADSLIAGDEND